MGQSGGSRVVCSCRLTMRLPYLPSLLVVVTILPVTLTEPDVFGDYFDDGMKLVDISQDAALRSCLSDGKTADKTKAAYDECYGQGYDFNDLAKAGGDDDGLPEELEEKEGCFYKKMGWVSDDNVMDEAAIAADMEGLENQIQEGFLNDVGTCVAWSGNFGERRKREAGMDAQGGSSSFELVPGLMDTGRKAMGWVRKLVRKVRSPGNRNSGKKNNPSNKKGGKGNERPKKKRGNGKKDAKSTRGKGGSGRRRRKGKDARKKEGARRRGKKANKSTRRKGGAARRGRNGGKGGGRKRAKNGKQGSNKKGGN